MVESSCNDFYICSILASSLEKNERLKPMNEVIEIIELSIDQQNTIDQSFKVEHLKDEMLLNKMFDYDFDDLDIED